MECLAKVAMAAPCGLSSTGAVSTSRTQSCTSASVRLSVMKASSRWTSQNKKSRTAGSRGLVVAMASPPSDIGEKLTQSIKEAEEVCAAENASGECAAAWDEVEELSAEIAHKRVQSKDTKDPLEQYCKEAPESDECRVYED